MVLAVSAAAVLLVSAQEGKPTPLAPVRPRVAPIAAPDAAPADPKDLQGSESAYYPIGYPYAYPYAAYPYAHPVARSWYGYPYAYIHG